MNSQDSNDSRQVLVIQNDAVPNDLNQTQAPTQHEDINAILDEQKQKLPDVDPVQGLSWIEQIQCNETIVNSVRVPFDYSRYIQVLRNPIKPDQLITVQIVKQKVFHHEKKVKNSLQHQRIVCKNGYEFDLVESNQKDRKCDVCEQNFPNNQVTQRWHHKSPSSQESVKFNQVANSASQNLEECSCEIQEICCKCNAKYFVRRKLDQKIANYFKYVPFEMIPKTNNQEEQKNENVIQADSKTVLQSLECNSQEYKDEKKESVLDFAKLEEHSKIFDDQVAQPSKFVVLGLWRHQEDNSDFERFCYKQFKIENPFLIQNFEDSNEVVLQDFLHYKGGKLFYFQKQKTDQNIEEIFMSTIDVDQLSTTVKTREDFDFNMHVTPLKKKQKVDQTMKTLLLNMQASCLGPKTLIQTRQFLSVSCKMLVFTTRLEATYTTQEDPNQSNTSRILIRNNSQTRNQAKDKKPWSLIFFDLEKLEQRFKIENAFLFLQMNSNEEAIQQNKIYEVWYMEETSVVKVSFKVIEGNWQQEQPKLTFLISPAADANQQNLPPNEAQKQQREFTNKIKSLWTQRQIEGRIHTNQKRVSLITENLEWLCFDLDEDKKTATQIFANSIKNDISSNQFVLANEKLYLSTYSCIKDININLSCNKLECNLIDLDQDVLYSSEGQQQEPKVDHSFYTRIPSDYCPGLSKYTKVKITEILHQKDTQTLVQKLDAVYVYKSHQTNQNGILFTSFQQKLNNNSTASQPVLENQYYVNYPLIMYKSYHPQNNILFVCNLATNRSQKLIDLGEFRFLCFVDQNIPLETTWRRKGETCIFFLVQSPTGSVRLMYYRTFVWLLDGNRLEGFPKERQDNLQLVSGKIQLDKGYDFSHIKKAILLVKVGTQIQAQLILQSISNVLGVKFQRNPDSEPLEIIEKDQTMVPLEMLCGQNKAYCLQRSKTTGDEIIIIGYDQESNMITKQVIYQQKAPILNMQLNYFDYGDLSDIETKLGIYIIDHDQQFKFIAPSQSQLHFTQRQDLSSEFETKSQIDLKDQEMKELLQDLVAQPWQGIQVSPRSVISARQADKKDSKERLKRMVLNIKSNTRTTVDYLDYNCDKIKNRMKEKSIHDIRQIPWIRKFLLVVQEADQMYFLIEEDIEKRRIDLMNVGQTRELIQNIVVLDSKIIVQLDYCCLIFDQREMLLSQVFQIETQTQKNKEKQEIPKIETSLPNPYGYEGKQYVEHNGLLYCYKISEPVIKQVRSVTLGEINKKITKQLVDKYKIKVLGVTPDKYVSPTGTTTLLFSIKSLGSDPKTDESSLLELKKISQRVQQDVQGQRLDKMKWLEAEITKIEMFFDGKGNEIEANSTTMLSDEQRFDLYCIKCTELTKNVKQELQILITQNYLVINAQTYIYFIKKDAIQCFDKEKNQIQKVLFKTICLSNLLQGDQSFSSSGVKLYPLEQEDFETVSQTKIRPDCIQISFAEEHIMWDLESNEEISFLLGQSQFLSEQDYVRTGFRLHIPIITPALNPKIKHSYLISTNWDQSIVGMNKPTNNNTKLCLCFKTFTRLDLYELQNIEKQLQNKKPIKCIDLETVFANIYGRTIFSLFYETPEIANLIQRMFQDYIDDKNSEFDNILVRKLFRILVLPARYGDATKESLVLRLHIKKEWKNEPLQEKNQENIPYYKQLSNTLIKTLFPGQHGKEIDVHNHHNLLSLGLNKDRQTQLDSYLEIMMLSREARFANVIQEYGQFQKILNISSPQAKNFLNNSSFMQTEMCKSINQVLWDPSKQFEVFGARSSLLSEEHILQKYERKIQLRDEKLYNRSYILNIMKGLLTGNKNGDNKKFCTVQVRIAEIEWVSQYLRDFFIYMAKLQNVDLFDNDLIKVLLQQQDYSLQLLTFGFVPFCFYMGLCQYYFTYILTDAIPTGQNGTGFFEGSSRDVTIRNYFRHFT